MRKSVSILLTLLLPVMALGLALAVPSGSPQDEAVNRHKVEYQPEEFSFLLDLRSPAGQQSKEDNAGDDFGVDFGDDDDYGVDFGDDDDYGVDFGDE